MQVVEGNDNTEALAMSAFEQLMAEETQAAAKAAGKKAKKLRQKSKKQQAHQAQPLMLSPEFVPKVESVSDSVHSLSFELNLFDDTDDQHAAVESLCHNKCFSRHLIAPKSDSVDEQYEESLSSKSYTHTRDSDNSAKLSSTQKRAADVRPGQNEAAQGQDSDAQFLQALFCCPLTKVNVHACRRYMLTLCSFGCWP